MYKCGNRVIQQLLGAFPVIRRNQYADISIKKHARSLSLQSLNNFFFKCGNYFGRFGKAGFIFILLFLIAAFGKLECALKIVAGLHFAGNFLRQLADVFAMRWPD